MLRRFILPRRAPALKRSAFALSALSFSFSVGVVSTLVIACGTTATTSAIAPITGIIVRADSLVAGRGCGEADSQVFGYAATIDLLGYIPDASIDVNDAADGGTIPLPLAGGSFPCYADGTFANLPSLVNYAVHVVAFNRKAWEAAGGQAAIDAASLPVDGGRLPIDALNALHPTWRTECTAKQQSNTEVLADCDPLSSTDTRPAPDASASDGSASDATLPDAGP